MTGLLQFKMKNRVPRERGRDDVKTSGVRQEILLDVVAIGLEQHARTSVLTNLLLRPLDHSVALAGVGRHHFACSGHFEALFGARLGLQLGHLALLWPARLVRPKGAAPAKMLARALKVLDLLPHGGSQHGHRHGSP